MPKLKVRQLAEAQKLNMSQLQKQSGVTMPSVRRYWYGTKDGKSTGEPLKVVDLSVLAAIAKVLGVKTPELIEDERLARLLATSGQDTSNRAGVEVSEQLPTALRLHSRV